MPIVPFLPLIIGAGASAVGAGLSAKGKKTTTTQENFDTIASQARSTLSTLLQNKLKQPLSLDPNLLSLALGGLNKGFNSAVPGLQNAMSARGLGQSGLFGGNLGNLELSRLGGVSTLMNQLAGTATDRQNTTINQLLALTGPTGQVGTSQGNTTSAIGAGLTDLGTTLGLLNMIGGLPRSKSSSSTSPASTSTVSDPSAYFNMLNGLTFKAGG